MPKILFQKGHTINKGRNPWNKGKKGVVVGYWKGKKRPEMDGNQFAKGNKPNETSFRKGVRYSPKTEFKNGQTSGPKNHNWKGGITPLIEKIRHLPEYIKWRKSVWARDYWTCQECKYKGKKIEAHHKSKPFSQVIYENKIKSVKQALNCKELWDLENGQTLCKKCHDKYNGYRTNK